MIGFLQALAVVLPSLLGLWFAFWFTDRDDRAARKRCVHHRDGVPLIITTEAEFLCEDCKWARYRIASLEFWALDAGDPR